MNLAEKPIGIFDSGLGGLTVLKEVMQVLPSENMIYFGDTGRTPYGSKSPETVIKYSRQIARFLLDQQIKLLVIACNTASARAYLDVCAMTCVPVVEVITPGARAAVEESRNRRIGVIGTRGTIDSGVYGDAIRRYAQADTKIYQCACPLFVSLAEEGWWDHDIARQIADIYLEPLKKQAVDTLVLGCTHYPLLKPVIHDSMGQDVRLIDAGHRVALQVQDTLSGLNQLNDTEKPGWHRYYTSDSVEPFHQLGSRFLNRPVERARRVDIEKYLDGKETEHGTQCTAENRREAME